jgi:hypothetical protein
MALTNMKMSKEESAEQNSVTAPESKDEYPYGLSINLDDDALGKLGLTQPMEVGAVLTLTARVEVRRCSSSQEQDGDKESSCTLQITDMELAAAVEKSGAQRAYPNSNMN